MNFKTTLVLLVLLAAVGAYLKFFALKRDPIPKENETVKLLVPESHFMNATHFALEREGRSDRETDVFSTFIVGKTRIGWRLLNPFRFVLREEVVESYLIHGLQNTEIVDRFKPDAEGYPGLEAAELKESSVKLTFRLLSKDQKHERQMQLQLGRALTAGRYYARLIAGNDDDEDIYIIRGKLPDQLTDIEAESWLQPVLGSPTLSAVKGLTVTMRQDDKDEMITARRQMTGGWKLATSGKSAVKGAGRGSESEIGNYLTQLGQLQAIDFRPVGSPSALKDYGLDQPRLRISIAASAGSTGVLEDAYILNVGRKDISGKGYYANWIIGAPSAPTRAVDDQGDKMVVSDFYPQAQVVMRISAPFIDKLFVEADALRERQILSLKETDLSQVEIAKRGFGSGDFSFDLIRKQGEWDFDREKTQVDFSIDRREVTSLITQLLGLTAEAFEHDAMPALLARTVAERPRIEVNVSDYLGKKSLYRFSPLYDPEKPVSMPLRKWLLQISMDPTNYVISEAQMRRVMLPPLSLRQRLALSIGLDRISHIQIDREDGETFEFKGGGANWSLAGYRYYDTKVMELLLKQIQSLSVAQWVVDAEPHLGEKALLTKLSLKTQYGRINVKVNVLSGYGSITWADRQEVAGSELIISTGSFRASPLLLTLMRGEYRLKPILGISGEKIRQIALGLGADTVFIQRSQRGEFYSKQLKNLDQKAAARLFDMAGGLTAIRYLNLPESLANELNNQKAQTQLQVTRSDGKVIVVDVMGKSDALMATHPELKGMAGIKSWLLVRVAGEVPVWAARDMTPEKMANDNQVVWCLMPEATMTKLLGMK